ncbi:LGFP repeat-containing protein [Tsukamurella pseudospumae]|uniref:LGFP repeat-containing protein n=1 Tax=Tsukamurella pseudospumae TaxID=239498 RepID=A0A138AKC5_9ACTN|nr:hypothetical protein [Tsukamurella pseudospumae]KXO90521.1 hypothetical protein AXK61_07865 [Tsukamurella pseudospumae]KXP10822.1 hypothetical protein AXK60_05950 [Tsukamurella pseudospumae]
MSTRFADRRAVGAAVALTAALFIAAGCSSTADTKDVASTTTASAAASTTTAGSSSSAGASASRPASSGSSAARSSTAAKPSGTVTAKGTDGSEVKLTGPIAVKYASATEAQRKGLGPVLMGSHNAGTRDSGVIFQQFKGGVITAKNADAGTPAYITWGKIRDAWNIERDAEGKPQKVGGANGSAGPLGAVTSDETTVGSVKQTTFEHGKITFNPQTGKVEVTVNGKVVPAGL